MEGALWGHVKRRETKAGAAAFDARRAWEAAMRQEVPRLRAGPPSEAARAGSAVRCVAFSPGGTHCAAGLSSGRTVTLDRRAGGGVVATRLDGHEGPVGALFWPEGGGEHCVLSGSDDGTVRQWDLRRPEAGEVHVYYAHTGWVRDIAPGLGGGRCFLSSGLDGVVREWRLGEPGSARTVLRCDTLARLRHDPEARRLALSMQNGAIALVHDVRLGSGAPPLLLPEYELSRAWKSYERGSAAVPVSAVRHANRVELLRDTGHMFVSSMALSRSPGGGRVLAARGSHVAFSGGRTTGFDLDAAYEPLEQLREAAREAAKGDAAALLDGGRPPLESVAVRRTAALPARLAGGRAAWWFPEAPQEAADVACEIAASPCGQFLASPSAGGARLFRLPSPDGARGGAAAALGHGRHVSPTGEAFRAWLMGGGAAPPPGERPVPPPSESAERLQPAAAWTRSHAGGPALAAAFHPRVPELVTASLDGTVCWHAR